MGERGDAGGIKHENGWSGSPLPKKERRVTKEQRRVSSPAKGGIELNESTVRTATVWAEGEVSLSTSTGTVPSIDHSQELYSRSYPRMV